MQDKWAFKWVPWVAHVHVQPDTESTIVPLKKRKHVFFREAYHASCESKHAPLQEARSYKNTFIFDKKMKNVLFKI